MKFYDNKMALNTRRARIFMAEKDIEMPMVEIDLFKREQFSDEFRSINPLCTLPVLETDDEVRFSQVPAITLYLEEIFPEHLMLGKNPTEKAQVREWMHRIFGEGFYSFASILRNKGEIWKDWALPGPYKLKQIPELVERGEIILSKLLDDANDHLKTQKFLVGDEFTMADIDLYVLLFSTQNYLQRSISDEQEALQKWYKKIEQRPSSSA